MGGKARREAWQGMVDLACAGKQNGMKQKWGKWRTNQQKEQTRGGPCGKEERPSAVTWLGAHARRNWAAGALSCGKKQKAKEEASTLGEREPAGGHARARVGRGPAGLRRGPTREKKAWEENRPREKKRKEAWAAGRCSGLLWPAMGPFLGQNAGLEPDQK